MISNGKGEGVNAWAKGFEVGAAGGVLMRSEAEAQGLDVVDYIAGHKAGEWERRQKEAAAVSQCFSPEVPQTTGNLHWMDYIAGHKAGEWERRQKEAAAVAPQPFSPALPQTGIHWIDSYERGYELAMAGEFITFQDQVGWYAPAFEAGYKKGREELEEKQKQAEPVMPDLRKRLFGVKDAEGYQVLVVAVRMPEGNIETIANHGQAQIERKLAYYMVNYDDQMRLKHNKDIQIVDFMLA